VAASIGFFIVGLLCAIISRILLMVAAFRVSVGWGLGIFLPFGPLFFRVSFPEDAARSAMFRMATVLSFAFSLLLAPKASYKHPAFTPVQLLPAKSSGYEMEKSSGAATKNAQTANAEQRQIANTRELERLRTWDAALRLRKRDLLRSDVMGNYVYNNELAHYNAALAEATAEKNLLATSVR
jgi:hypothetical protein